MAPGNHLRGERRVPLPSEREMTGSGALLATALAIAAATAPTAAAAPPAERVVSIRCWPSGACPGGLKVPIGGHLLVRTELPVRAPIASIPGVGSVKAGVTRNGRILIRVPTGAQPGPIRVSSEGRGWSMPTATVIPTGNGGITPPRPTGSAFDGNGMWIWELPNTERGNLGEIIRKAKRHDVSTLFIKSSDGDHMYPRSAPQFTPTMLRTLKDAGLQVCAWPFVYGKAPKAEATMTIRAIRMGADCLAIDAEGQYEGRYAAARSYVKDVRTAAGRTYPISLAGLPYVDYHPSFPYSVFLGPGGAQVNQPQAYWKAIGRPLDTVLAHTWSVNLPYGRRIFPLGQLWQSPTHRELIRFRALSARWGAAGLSWWDWQESKLTQWPALGSALPWPAKVPDRPEPITLRPGNRGDLVLWAQQHLKAAGTPAPTDGSFGRTTEAAVRSFQSSRRLEVDGRIGPRTWSALLRVKLPTPAWATASASARPDAAVHRSEFRVPRPG